jgi:hypothetical protein
LLPGPKPVRVREPVEVGDFTSLMPIGVSLWDWCGARISKLNNFLSLQKQQKLEPGSLAPKTYDFD